MVRIDDTGAPEDPYEVFLAEGSPESVVSWLEDEEEPISINYTSGTTGQPKGAVYTYRGAYLDVPRDGTTMGEVAMHGNIVMKGYFEDPDATATAFEGGWFHSGDLAVCHHDGYIELRDRKKDVIISGGENISTIEVEQVVVQHPAVMECAVVAIPDKKWGERPKAFVTLKPDQNVTEAELIAFCRERLAHFKCPAAVEFGGLPKGSTGKVQKFVLRGKEWGEHEKRIH